MITLTLKIDEKKKAGKALLELIDLFNSKEKKTVEVVEEKSPYNPSFVKKIRQSQEEIKQGKYKVLNSKDIWGSLGL